MQVKSAWIIPLSDTDRMEGMRINFEVPFMAICPIPDKPYAGTLEVEYSPHGLRGLVEWDGFAEWIRNRRDEEYSAEDFALFVWNVLASHLSHGEPRELRGTGQLKVTARADVAFHLPVEVTVE